MPDTLPPFIPRKAIRYRHNAAAPATPTPAAPLVLVAAAYDENDAIVFLTFDRPVNVAAFDGSAVFLGDPTFNNTAYAGTSPASLDAPTIVRVVLTATGPYFNTEVDLNVGAGNGIVAADDGGTWAGTGGVIFLPYP